MELENKQLQVFDISGKLLMEQPITQPIFEVLMQIYAHGTHIIKVKSFSQQKEWEVVKR